MGILNVTPDSFSDGGNFFGKNDAVAQALKLLHDGADIIDIGGESTRPGAESISENEEIKRVLPVIEDLKRIIPDCVISVDTTKFGVAKAAAEAGAAIINDISGLGIAPELAPLAAKMDLSLILMHIQGAPRTMQTNPQYKDVVREVYDFLHEKIEFARTAGVKKIYADVGIGFGKTLEHNLELLRNLSEFKKLGAPIVLGISRKSFIGKILDIPNPEERDVPTALIHALLLGSDVDIIRVHNVEMISRLKRLYLAIKSN